MEVFICFSSWRLQRLKFRNIFKCKVFNFQNILLHPFSLIILSTTKLMNKVLDTKSFILDDFLRSSYPLMRHHIPKQNPQLHYWKSLDFLCPEIHLKNPLNRQMNKREKRKNNNTHLAVRISGSYPSLRIFRVISSTLLFVSMNTILLFSFSAIISFNNVLSLQRNAKKK